MGGYMAREGTIVTAIDEEGKEWIFPSVNAAVPVLNISPTTIRRYAKNGGKVMTRVGLVELKTKKSTEN